MKTNIFTSVFRQWIIIISLAFWFFPGWTQQNIGRQTILQFDANTNVLKPDAPLLTESIPMERGRNNPLFLSGVGGVSFDKIASPASGIKITNLSMNYNKNAEDGNRLELQINNKPVKVNLPDWMLIPIAKYAESPYYSCFTLFGKLKDKTLEKKVTDHKGRVINYHPAFDNTLIGIRLAYMDMIIGYSFATNLPKDNTGKYILGYGEVQPNVNANIIGANNLYQYVNQTENKYKLAYRSYVISDYTRQITFNISQNTLNINGVPYYYCWRYNGDQKDYDINKVAKSISSKYNQKIQTISASTGSNAVHDWLVEKIISLAEKYNGNYGFYSNGTFTDLVNLKTETEKKQFISKYSPESLLDIIVKTESYMDQDSIIYMKEFSDDVSSKPELLEAVNPAVWKATVSTMRYAAFFRYVKTNFPKAWIAFLSQVKQIEPQPSIITPTIMYNSKSLLLQLAIQQSLNR